MRACSLFDKYRDGELSDALRGEFKSHLQACEDCRTRWSLLNNLVSVLKQESIQPMDLADRIARRAFEPSESWDAMVASWLRPRFALAALGMVLLLVSILWLVPARQPVAAFSEYETLLKEAEASNLAGSLLLHADGELIMRLEQEGYIQ